MKIYNKSGVEILDVNVTDNSYRYREIMSSHELTLYFSLNYFIELPVDSYTDFQGERFYLFDKSNFKKNSSKDREYTLVLHNIAERLTRFKFYDFAGGGYIFSLTAKPIDHIQMIVNVLNAKDAGWTVGDVIDSSEIVVSYNHNLCLEALGLICDEVETEFEITSSKVINLRKTEYNKSTPLNLAYGQGNGLKPGVERKNDEKSRPVERLMVQGGTRNIDYSVYGSKYLLLPKLQTLVYNGRTYTTDANGLYIQRADKAIETGQEGSLDASTVYPSRICIVTQVTAVDALNNKYNVVDSTIPEALNFEDNLIAGQTMTAVFQTGMLAGKEFEVKYTHEGRVFSLVAKDIDGYTMPGGSYVPNLADTFVVFGCSFPEAYICDNVSKTGASWDMFREAVAYLYENEEDKYSYTGPISPIWVKENWDTVSGKLKLGGYCSLNDAELGGVLIRIKSIKDMVNNPYDITIDLSNALVKPSFSTVLAKLNSYQASLTVQQLKELQDSGIDITNISNLLSNYYLDNDALADYLKQLGLSIFDTETKIISGAVIWRSGLTFDATVFKYKILGVNYTSPATELTLSDADPSYPRIDVFYLDTFGNIKIKTGTPSPTPIEPTLTLLELKVTPVYIGAGALTPSNITVEQIYDEHTVYEWETATSVDAGKTSIDVESTTDPYTGSKHIKIGIEVPADVEGLPDHYIGEEYQGGIIFWIDPADKRKGLIAAKEDVANDVFWSRLSGFETYTTGATGSDIGDGENNTTLMLATPAAAGQAVKYVYEYVTGLYSDWYLPSEKELYQMWFRRMAIRNMGTKTYWSSTEASWQDARCIAFTDGVAYSRDKNNKFNVRPIRKFDDSTITAPEYYTPLSTNIIFSAGAEFSIINSVFYFRMKTSAAWRANSVLLIETYKGAVRTGSCAICPASNLFGFDPTNNESYQLVAISYSNFLPTQSKFDAVKISLTSSWPNNMQLLLDSIAFQFTQVIEQNQDNKVLQVQDQVLTTSGWVADGDIFSYTYTNPKITDASIVDIIPFNDDLEIVEAANILPETESTAGSVKIWAKNIPGSNIRITVNITEATL